MTRDEDLPDDALVPIGVARRLLGVGRSTLVLWAAEGRIPQQRTAGGHRRFRVRDLRAIARGSRPEPSGDSSDSEDNRARVSGVLTA